MAEAVIVVEENAERERYELHVDGQLAGVAEYRGGGPSRALTHTEIEPAFEGRGLAGELIRRTLDDLRARDLHVIPICPFVKAYLHKHPEYVDLVEPKLRAAFGLES